MVTMAGAGINNGAAPIVKFGYDAVANDARRPRANPILRSEDRELQNFERRLAQCSTRDLMRNFSAVIWAVRMSVLYTSRFVFASKIGDEEIGKRYASTLDEKTAETLNRQVEELIWEWSQKGNLDAAGRYSLNKFMALIETARLIDGDIGILKLKDGTIQPVEADRIRTSAFDGLDNNDGWTQGVKTNKAGRFMSFRVFRRSGLGGGQFELEREINAENMILHGYYNRFDQIRGISPLLTAANTFQDIYKSLDYALIKAKISQMLGYKFTIDPNFSNNLGTKEEKDETTNYRTQVLKENAAFFYECNVGENLELIDNKTPSSEFQDYMKVSIMIAMKALDIPYAMFDETTGKFYGNKSAILQYLETAKPKRRDNIELLNQLTRWRLNYEVANGRLKLPRGMTANDIYFTWTPEGTTWWDDVDTLKTEIEAVKGNILPMEYFDSIRGIDTREKIRQIAREKEWYTQAGLKHPSEQEKTVIDKIETVPQNNDDDDE
ncbi:MAG: phage portal protein [Planctomycetaceae bacterium]|nr:phage portal protein [Planctomycetaceae bacterium]